MARSGPCSIWQQKERNRHLMFLPSDNMKVVDAKQATTGRVKSRLSHIQWWEFAHTYSVAGEEPLELYGPNGTKHSMGHKRQFEALVVGLETLPPAILCRNQDSPYFTQYVDIKHENLKDSTNYSVESKQQLETANWINFQSNFKPQARPIPVQTTRRSANIKI